MKSAASADMDSNLPSRTGTMTSAAGRPENGVERGVSTQLGAKDGGKRGLRVGAGVTQRVALAVHRAGSVRSVQSHRPEWYDDRWPASHGRRCGQDDEGNRADDQQRRWSDTTLMNDRAISRRHSVPPLQAKKSANRPRGSEYHSAQSAVRDR